MTAKLTELGFRNIGVLDQNEKIKLNQNIKNWLEFQLDDDVFEIRSNIE